jgi:hypothetical protein
MLSPERILAIVGGVRAAETLFAALEVGVFTELGKGPRSAAQLQRALALDAGSAAGFFDELVTLGLLDRDGSGHAAIYLNSREAARFLDGNSPAYIGARLRDEHANLAPLWRARTEELRAPAPALRSR